jgi:creatinine amidohydrolase
MMNCPKPLWAEMAWTDFQNSDVANWIAVLPLAATEQHGPHLPLGTDTMIMEGYLDRVRAGLPDDIPATFLPVQTVGLSPEHSRFPGTLTLTPETALRTWVEIGESVHRAGVRKLVLVSSHGGNNALMDVAARELRVRHGLFVVTTAFSRFGYPEDAVSSEEVRHGVHAGAIETSLMLAFRPDLVRMEHASDFRSAAEDLEAKYHQLRFGRPASMAWLAGDMNVQGAVGRAQAGSAELGDGFMEPGIAGFVELLRDVAAFDPASLGSGVF